MLLISEALQIIEKQTAKLSIEQIELADSRGRVLAEKIRVNMDLPPFNHSQMDGFAVRAKDTKDAPVKFKIVGESSAGNGWQGKLRKSEAVRIMTGAPMPNGADAVQKVELTNETDGFITILQTTKPKQSIVNRGEEIKKGEKIFERGEISNENMIAVLASFGYAKVKVLQRPKMAILATGSEIVDITEKPKQDQIRNSNSISLKILAEKCADVEILPIVRDEI